MDRRLKIVIADDEPDTREYLLEYLSHLGHDVVAAADGRQLVEACRQFLPDLVITDYAMPRLNGLAAATEVNRERQVPVILFSGRHDVEATARAAGCPVARFLAKPISEPALRSAIDSVTADAEH